MNSTNISGRLTAEPELKHTQNGTAVCSYTLAVDRPKVKDTTDFLNFVTWRQGAEYLCQYGHKGDMVEVTGSLTSRKWQDNNGNNRISFEVLTDTVKIVSSSQNNQNSNTQPQFRPQPQPQKDYIDITNDENLPF